ncbi:MAG: ABC transporter substrate-binding protein [Pseudomonadota bacterium]
MKRLLAGLLVLVFSSGIAFSQQTPRQVIEETANAILTALDGRHEELRGDREALYDLVDDIMLPRFDLQFAGAYVLGKYRRQATPEQKKRFVTAFYRSLVQRYADGLLEYRQDSVEFLPFKPSTKPTRATVRTVVTLADGTKTPVDYGLRETKQGWKVYDVTIEGISYLQNNRKIVTSEIGKSGLDNLIERLEAGSVKLD